MNRPGAGPNLCLAVCAPGIEAICADELAALGVRIRRTLLGGVEFSATDRQLYAANLWSRTATRVLVRVARFEAPSFGDLERELAAVDWGQWVPEGTTPTVRVSSTSSRLYHTDAVGERVAALTGSGPDRGPLVVVRLMHDRGTVSVDSSGAPLHQRGWRLETAKAPIRETLAAALLLSAGWDPGSPLLDPFAGAGTIAIEAARLAAGVPPGEGRTFAFQDWPCFATGTWASVRGDVTPASTDGGTIVATDRDAGAVRATRANAERAGVGDRVTVKRASFSEMEPPPGGPGWVVTNPPYGKRVSGGSDLRDLYARLGTVITARFADWVVAVVAADRRAVGHSRLAFTERLSTQTGGIPVQFLVAEPPVRSMDGPHHRRGTGHGGSAR